MRAGVIRKRNRRDSCVLAFASFAGLLILAGGWPSIVSSGQRFSVGGAVWEQRFSNSPQRISILGRDTWLPAGTSRLLRVVALRGTEFVETTPLVTFSPGPVVVNYVIATSKDLTVSITVPYETEPGPQTMDVTDGTSDYHLADAIKVVDGTISPLSPAVFAVGTTTEVSIQPHSLFADQSSFTLDLGSNVRVGPVTMQPDGSLQTSVRVEATALPGVRSVHLTAGAYSLVGERGFGVDFGPLVTRVHLNITGIGAGPLDVRLPRGYTARVLASGTTANGLYGPDGMHVDETNTLYVLNQGGPFRSPPFSISVFDLSPNRFGRFKTVLRDIDAAGRGGLLESGTMIPGRPGKLFVTTEDFYPPDNYRGGRTIHEVDTATGGSRLFWYNPLWNLDPIRTDVQGNLVLGHTINYAGPQGAVSVLDPNANVLKKCDLGVWTDILVLDPLKGTFLINRPVGFGGVQSIDLSDCTTTMVSDGPRFDEGWFGPAAGDFGNQLFVPVESGEDLLTLYPVSPTDPDQTFPERAVVFASGIPCADGIAFDRDGRNMLVIAACNHAVIAISRHH